MAASPAPASTDAPKAGLTEHTLAVALLVVFPIGCLATVAAILANLWGAL